MGIRNHRVQRDYWTIGESEEIRRNCSKAQRLLWAIKTIAFVVAIIITTCFLDIKTAESKIYLRNKNFIDIEVPLENSLVFCFHMNPKDKLSMVLFYALDENKILHEFMYRVLIPKAECLKSATEYNSKLLRGAKTVRLVGIGPNAEEKLGRIEKDFPPGSILAKFKQTRGLIYWTFIRLQTEKGCRAYFSEDCILPKNYWAGLGPQVALPQ